MSKYDTNVLPYLEYIEAWCRDGVPEEQIAKKLNIAPSTFWKYKAEKRELSEVLARTKEYVDLVQVVGAYKRRAVGYDYNETKVKYKYVKKRDGTIEKVPVGEEITRKHVPGDPRAMEFWLRTRQRELWGQAIETTADDVQNGVIEIPAVAETTETATENAQDTP